jgi:hypothetical protein
MPDNLLRDGGAVAGGIALMAQIWSYIKARIEKEDRRSEIRTVILEVVNPPLLTQKISDMAEKIDHLTHVVQTENSDAITKATMDAMERGFLLRAKRGD